MSEPVLKLVLKDSRWDGIDIGWRHFTEGLDDVMWGSTKNDTALREVLNQMKTERQRDGESDLELVDERVATRGNAPLPKQLFELSPSER